LEKWKGKQLHLKNGICSPLYKLCILRAQNRANAAEHINKVGKHFETVFYVKIHILWLKRRDWLDKKII
jgi:hypothetical protein